MLTGMGSSLFNNLPKRCVRTGKRASGFGGGRRPAGTTWAGGSNPFRWLSHKLNALRHIGTDRSTPRKVEEIPPVPDTQDALAMREFDHPLAAVILGEECTHMSVLALPAISVWTVARSLMENQNCAGEVALMKIANISTKHRLDFLLHEDESKQ
ncbi:MAG: hypothetical protein U1F33_05805 [Alphaproteobacteria bacterium]